MNNTGGNVTPEVLTLSDLLKKGCYGFPLHQRNYDWSPRQVRELLEDIDDAINGSSGYFLGTVLLMPQEEGHWEINDGQQRLITLSAVVALLRRKFKEENPNGALEARAYEMLFDVDNVATASDTEKKRHKPRITPPENYGDIYESILKGNDWKGRNSLTVAVNAIGDLLGKKWPTLDEQKELFKFLDKKILLSVLYFPKSINPGGVFESINARGKPLENFDLLRNYFYQHFYNYSERNRRATLHTNLERIREECELSGGGSVEDKYAHTFLQCEYGYLHDRVLYGEVRDKIREQSDSGANRVDYIENLVSRMSHEVNLHLYKAVVVPESFDSREIAKKIMQETGTATKPRRMEVFLRELQSYTVSHTLVFALLHYYMNASVDERNKAAQVAHRGIGSLASFIIRTSFVVRSLKPDLYKEDFATLARDIITKNGFDENYNFFKFFKDNYEREDQVTNDDWFIDRMREMEFHRRSDPKAKRFLAGINALNQTDEELLNVSKCSLEHILPWSESYLSGWESFNKRNHEECRVSSGNLTLLGPNDNKPGVRNKNFMKKKEILSESAVKMSRDLKSRRGWSPATIKARQRDLANDSVKAWPFMK